MNIEQLFDKRVKELNRHKRTAYLPSLKKNENTFSHQSKLGGFPYLRNKHDWPYCLSCSEPMSFLLQLNLNNLPEVEAENAIIQIFDCSTYFCDIHFSKRYLCRKQSIKRICKPSSKQFKTFTKNKVNKSGRIHIYGEKIINGWKTIDDYPSEIEYKQLGIEELRDIEVEKLMHKREFGMTICKTKLFGWPYWLQYQSNYPEDRKTGNKMKCLFQLLDYFGDGVGYLMQSTDNSYELNFSVGY